MSTSETLVEQIIKTIVSETVSERVKHEVELLTRTQMLQWK